MKQKFNFYNNFKSLHFDKPDKPLKDREIILNEAMSVTP